MALPAWRSWPRSLPRSGRSVGAAIDWFSVGSSAPCALTVSALPVDACRHSGTTGGQHRSSLRLRAGVQYSRAAGGGDSERWQQYGALWRTRRHRQAVEDPGAAGWQRDAELAADDDAAAAVLDYARSYRPMVRQIAQQVPAGARLVAPDSSRGRLAALGASALDADPRPAPHRLPLAGAGPGRRIGTSRSASAARCWPAGECETRVRRPTDRDEVIRSTGAVLGLRSLGHRPVHPDPGPGTGCGRSSPSDLAVDRQLGAMALHHMLDDRQAQPVPPVSRERLAVDPVKRSVGRGGWSRAMPMPLSFTSNTAPPPGRSCPADRRSGPRRAYSAPHCWPGDWSSPTAVR